MPTPSSDDRDQVVLAGVSAGDRDTALGRAERRGVVEQLGEEVGDVGDDVAAHLQMVEVEDVDPPVVLDLADRGAHDVVDLGGLRAAAPRTRRWRARADSRSCGACGWRGGRAGSSSPARRGRRRRLRARRAWPAGGRSGSGVRRAIVTKMSDTPRRSTSTCSWATSTSVDCTTLKAPASSPSSSRARRPDRGDLGDHGLTARVAQCLDERRQLDRSRPRGPCPTPLAPGG